MTRISRRGLLTSGAAAGVLAATGLPLSAAARRGGTLRAGLSGASRQDSWDARTHADLFMIAAAQGAVFDTLTEVAADGSLKGELAETWEASPDARVWTFRLRRGVEFHNGAPFRPEDVIASLKLHLEDGTASPARPIVESIAEMAVLGPHDVRLTLHEGNADFPYLMSDYHLLIYPADHMQEALAKGIGTGLYRVKDFQPGRRMTAVRVDGHYKGDTAGFFDQIDYLAMNDAREREKALMAARVDVVSQLDPRSLPRVSAHPSLRVIETSGNRHYSFPMRADRAPFEQTGLRQALKYGIDRPALLEAALSGHGRVATDSPIGPANQYFADLPSIDYDPDRARHHLSRAGYDTLSVDLHVSEAAFEGAEAAAQSFRKSASAAGIILNIVPEPQERYWTDVWGKRPVCAARWSGRATEDWMFSTAYAASAPWNDTGWDHPQFQSLMRDARTTLDSSLRRDLYAEMQHILRDEGSTVIPVFATDLQAVSCKIGCGAQTGALWPMDNARMAERWWSA